MPLLLDQSKAFGEPGIAPRWTSARKEAVGTAYSVASRVWFTIWNGIVTEVYYPTVDRPQIRDWQFLITDGETFFHEEKRDLHSKLEFLRPDALAYRIVNESTLGYQLEKTVIADPHLPCVLQRVKLHAPPELKRKLKLYSLCAPRCGGGGSDNDAHVCEVNGRKILVANKKNTWLAMGNSLHFSKVSCGYVGNSDGWTDLADNRVMDWEFDHATSGNIAIMGEILLDESDEFVAALAFGHGLNNAVTALLQTLSYPFDLKVDRVITQWQRAQKLAPELAQHSFDDGFLLQASHNLLLAHEDKLNPGAFIASLSVPWGQAKGDEDLGGYHLVWPRDMVNTATALIALGRPDTALRALAFFACNQLADGRFPQNFWISGEPYFSGIQLDEIAFPIILAWRLREHCRDCDFDPYPMILKAASFLVLRGPITQQERWEEASGFSPSTLAANIAGMICAAGFAREHGDSAAAELLEDYADYLYSHLREWTVTTCGDIHPDIAEHFVRINPVETPGRPRSPNETTVWLANQAPDANPIFPSRNIIDAGFLELIRYGIISADDPLVKQSLEVVDYVLRVDTPNGPSWRRYNHDGYGQKADGTPFTGWGVGRAWPLLTGERAHYELAAGGDPRPYIRSLERFASEGGTLPEQVWDQPDVPELCLYLGKPTGSAMPLIWAHSEYIKLLRSVADGRVFDQIPDVVSRYQATDFRPKPLEIWHKDWQVETVQPGSLLRIVANQPFKLTCTTNNWKTSEQRSSVGTSLGVDYIDIAADDDAVDAIEFTFYWLGDDDWEGRDYRVTIQRNARVCT